MRELGVEADLFYLMPSYVNTLPAWEDGEVDEGKLGPRYDFPDVRAFKFQEPEWTYPFGEGNGVEMARKLLTEGNYDVVVGLWPFPLALLQILEWVRTKTP